MICRMVCWLAIPWLFFLLLMGFWQLLWVSRALNSFFKMLYVQVSFHIARESKQLPYQLMHELGSSTKTGYSKPSAQLIFMVCNMWYNFSVMWFLTFCSYGKTKEDFGWPEEPEDFSATVSGAGTSSSAGGGSEASASGSSASAPLPLTAVDRLVSAALETLDGCFVATPAEKIVARAGALDLATKLLNLPLPPTVQVSKYCNVWHMWIIFVKEITVFCSTNSKITRDMN